MLKKYLLLTIPLLIVLALGFFWIDGRYTYIREVVAFTILTFLFVVVISFFKRRLVFLLFYLLLSILAFLKLSFYYLFNVKINASAFYVIFETNSYEVNEFLSDFLKFPILVLAFFFTIGFLVTYFKTKRFVFKNYSFLLFKKAIPKITVAGLFIALCFILFSKFKHENIIIEAISSFKDYQLMKKSLQGELAKEVSTVNVTTTSFKEPSTYIVVIGESTSNWHMQLYGYGRETNPLLSSIREELYVFNEVISPHVHTMMSLQKILTLSEFNNPKPSNNISLVQLANQAGFNTYWLSNQKPFGIHETIPSIIGNAAKNKLFVNSEESMYQVYDDKIFPSLHNILSRKNENKIVFIHLMGTHSSYKRRYPKSFDFFKEKNFSKFGHKQSIVINEYDNAVRYNDYIIFTIIQSLKKQNLNSYMMYFSDHGDEVFDTEDFMGHNEYIATRPMYEVPFIVWTSDKFKYNNNLLSKKLIENRKYNLEDLTHSFSDLSSIDFDGFDKTKSIFNSGFKEKQLVIKQGEVYKK